MEILLTVLVWLWQIGWTLMLGGLLCILVVVCVKPLRKRRTATFVVCTAAVCLVLALLCAKPAVVCRGSAEEKAQIRQLAAGRYSRRLPFTPVCAVADRESGEVQIWYAFAGRMSVGVSEDGYSVTEPLFAWD